MAKQRYLKKAPIVEALIDFRVRLSSNFDIKIFEDIKELSRNYPKCEERRHFEFGLDHGNNEITTRLKNKGLNGYIYKSKDGLNMAQFRIDGFTANRLKPYNDWESLLKEAKKLWTLYINLADVEDVSRLAVRYINRFTIPRNVKQLNDYLISPPTLPESIEGTMKAFNSRLVITDADTNCQSNIVQRSEPTPNANESSITLDIDVFRDGAFQPDDNDLWQLFAKMRCLKNQYFFELVTDRLIKEY